MTWLFCPLQKYKCVRLKEKAVGGPQLSKKKNNESSKPFNNYNVDVQSIKSLKMAKISGVVQLSHWDSSLASPDHPI